MAPADPNWATYLRPACFQCQDRVAGRLRPAPAMDTCHFLRDLRELQHDLYYAKRDLDPPQQRARRARPPPVQSPVQSRAERRASKKPKAEPEPAAPLQLNQISVSQSGG